MSASKINPADRRGGRKKITPWISAEPRAGGRSRGMKLLYPYSVLDALRLSMCSIYDDDDEDLLE